MVTVNRTALVFFPSCLLLHSAHPNLFFLIFALRFGFLGLREVPSTFWHFNLSLPDFLLRLLSFFMLPICLHIFSGSRLALSTPFLSILFSLYFFIILSLSVSFHPIEHSFHFNCLPNSHSFSFLSALSPFPLPIPLFFPSWYFTQWQLTFLADAFFSLLAFFSFLKLLFSVNLWSCFLPLCPRSCWTSLTKEKL